MKTELSKLLLSTIVTIPALFGGCGDQHQDPPDDIGTLALPLIASSSGNRLFVLCQGSLEIQNADNTKSWTINAAEHAAEQSVRQSLPAGEFWLSLSDWQLCEAIGDEVIPIAAKLESAPQVTFHVYPLETTYVAYSFVVEGLAVTFGGDVVIQINVREGSFTGEAGAAGQDSAGGTSGNATGGSSGAGGMSPPDGVAGAASTEGCAAGYHLVSTGACNPILFADDFDDGVVASDWQLWKMTFTETNGRMNATGQPRPGFNYGHSGNGRSATLATHIGDTTWTDYRIDLDGQALAVGSFNPYGLPSCYRSFGIGFRVESATESWNEPEVNSYGVSFFPESAGCSLSATVAGGLSLGSSHHGYLAGTGCCNNAPSGSNRTLIDTNYPKFVDGPSHYAIEVVGNNIKFWVNADLVFDYTDDTVAYVNGAEPLTYGGIEIGWGWELPGWVDNVVVTDMR